MGKVHMPRVKNIKNKGIMIMPLVGMPKVEIMIIHIETHRDMYI